VSEPGAPRVLIDAERLRARVQELGAEVARDYRGRSLALVGVMKGSLCFLADLARAIDLPLTIDLAWLSSYRGGTASSGEVRVLAAPMGPLAGRDVLVVEDILDTGTSLRFLLTQVLPKDVASVNVAVLLHKPGRAVGAVPLGYVGFEIGDEFVVGYGLDLAERYRNLPYVGYLAEGPGGEALPSGAPGGAGAPASPSAGRV
jgi:hypoxanthine phosphoribosyltransferase